MIKLITALDLHNWADTKESEVMMPELIRRLIHSSLNSITWLSMPTGDSVSLPGFDGELESDCGNAYISKGKTVFEMGTDKAVKRKADRDIKKRNDEIDDEKKEALNYVFITPRKWRDAKKWERENRENSKWREIRVLTAIELEDWVFQCPNVAIWLATKLGLLGEGINIDSLEGYWEKWSVNTHGLHLDYGVLTGGREENVRELINAILHPSMVSVISGSTEESLAFAVASILDSGNAALIDRCVIAHDAHAIKELMTSYKNLVIVTSSNERSINYGVSKNNDSIIYASNFVDKGVYGTEITLCSHDYHKFQESLIKSGMTETEARIAAKESGRNIVVLRHQQGFDLTKPAWTEREDLLKVLPALLLGRWNDAYEGDRVLLESITGLSKDELTQLLQVWANLDSSPFQHINNVWYVVSPYDAFLYVKGYITDLLLEKYQEVLKKVLSDIDPNALNKLNPDIAIYTLGERTYSGLIKEGLCLNLILIALQIQGGQSRVDSLVKGILEGSTIEWWLSYSNSDIISYLAEASPRAYLDYIEKNIKEEKSVIKDLFVPIKKSSYFTGGYEIEYTHVLFALEMLAWMPEYLLRVSYVLAELDKIPNDSNYSNKPFNSLVDIYRLWFPKTMADAEGRSKALGAIMRRYPQVGVKLCISLATRIRNQHVSFSQLVSRWRLRDIVSIGSVSGYEMYFVLKKICELIVANCLPTPEEAISILKIATDNSIPLELRRSLLNHVVDNSVNYKQDKTFYEELMKMVYRFKNASPKYHWRISDEEINRLEELLSEVSPENVTDRLEYLLNNPCYDLPEVHKISDYQQRFMKVEQLRHDAVNQIVDEIGVEAFLEYAINLNQPQNALQSFAKRKDGFQYFDYIYNQVKIDQLKYDAYKDYFRQLSIENKIEFLEKVKDIESDSFVWFPLAAAVPCDEVWSIVDSLTDNIQYEYWLHASLVLIPIERVKYLTSHFLEVERYHEVIQILYNILHDNNVYVDVVFVVETMKRVMTHLNGHLLGICSYELEMIMEWIDKDENVSDEDVIALELPYIISQRGRMSEWRSYQIILQNPKHLFELIDHAFLSDDEEEQKRQMEEMKNDTKLKALSQFSTIMLMEIHTMPCVDDDGNIDENSLKAYVAELIKMGKEMKKISHVYHILGCLFACDKSVINERPKNVICELIDEISDNTLNNSYHAKIYNRLGSTVRGPFDGGDIEWNRAKRFDDIAKELQMEYPVTASIYRGLAEVYKEEAKRQDTEAEMLKLDN